MHKDKLQGVQAHSTQLLTILAAARPMTLSHRSACSKVSQQHQVDMATHSTQLLTILGTSYTLSYYPRNTIHTVLHAASNTDCIQKNCTTVVERQISKVRPSTQCAHSKTASK